MQAIEDEFLSDLLHLGKLYQNCFQEATSEYRLSPTAVAVLLFLIRNTPGRDTATDIAQAHGISKAMIARSVDGLQRRGYLKGERDSEDRRVVHLHLYGDGIKAAELLQQNCVKTMQRLMQGVTQEELLTVQKIMNKMCCNLNEPEESTKKKGAENHD